MEAAHGMPESALAKGGIKSKFRDHTLKIGLVHSYLN